MEVTVQWRGLLSELEVVFLFLSIVSSNESAARKLALVSTKWMCLEASFFFFF